MTLQFLRALRGFFVLHNFRALKLSFITLFVLGLFACSHSKSTQRVDLQENNVFELVVLHINDTHSAFDPYLRAVEYENQTYFVEVGGHPRLQTALQQARLKAMQANQNHLFLHGGDAWQGSAYFLQNKGRMNADILNQLGLDAMALGNHEFDLSLEHLKYFTHLIDFPLVVSNLEQGQLSAEQQLKIAPFVLFKFNEAGVPEQLSVRAQNKLLQGQQNLSQLSQNKELVAVIGLALEDMPEIAPNTGDLVFEPMVKSAQRTVDLLTQAGINKILAVTHIGLEQDIRLAKAVNGIDLIVGGHSHTLLGDFSAIGWGGAFSANNRYAQQITNPDGVGLTCVVQAGHSTQALGQLRVQFNSQGQVQDCAGQNHLLFGTELFADAAGAPLKLTELEQQALQHNLRTQTGAYFLAENSQMRSYIDQTYAPALTEAYGEVIGYVGKPLKHVRKPGENNSNEHGSELAPLVAYAQYSWMKQPEVVQATGKQPDFSLIGAGSIRTDLAAGELREGHISLEMLPFRSYLALVPITGARLVELLNFVIEQTLDEQAHTGKFPYGGNLRYEYQAIKGKNGELQGKVTRVELNRGSLLEPNWQPIQPNEIYQMVTTHYSAAGNDGWDLLYRWQQDSSERIDVTLVNQQVEAFSVKRVRVGETGGFQTLYQEVAPNCEAAEVYCGVDALAVQQFIRENWQQVKALPEPSVTFKIQNR